MLKKIRFLASLTWAVCAWVPLQAGAIQAPVAADVHLNSAAPTTNFGTQPRLTVGGGNTGLINFDLSALPAGTSGGGIVKATLFLWVNRINTAGAIDLPV